MRPLKSWKVLVIVLCVSLAIAGCHLKQGENIQDKVQQAKRDLLTLYIGIDLCANWMGGMVPIPDAMFTSASLREQYNLPLHLDQAQIDELLARPVNTDLKNHIEGLQKSPNNDWPKFYMRHRAWHCLTEPIDYLAVAALVVEGELDYKDAYTFETGKADARRGVPLDPFSSAPYRYLLMPDYSHPYTYLIVSDGPDGDSDITLPFLLFGKDDPSYEKQFFDAIYDPTNGTVSNGDIVLIHDRGDSGVASRGRLPTVSARDYREYMKKYRVGSEKK